MDDQTIIIIKSIANFMNNASDIEVLEIFENMPYDRMYAIYTLLISRCE